MNETLERLNSKFLARVESIVFKGKKLPVPIVCFRPLFTVRLAVRLAKFPFNVPVNDSYKHSKFKIINFIT